MTRVKISYPETFHFTTEIVIRISDINYGNHLSNDAYLKYMHEARMQFFNYYQLSEMNVGEGVSVIMGDCAIVFKRECFYGQNLRIDVAAADFGPRSFNLYYKFTDASNGQPVCEAKTGMVCFDYVIRKTTSVPESFVKLFTH
jgi:acyl-CoA thioesterase FadM